MPPWLQNMVLTSESGEWDDFHYRASIEPLRRHGLIRSSQGPWNGTTMHGLVQWRSRREGNYQAYWRWYMVFITAACYQVCNDDASVHFIRHMIPHLPASTRLVEENNTFSGSTWAWMQVIIGYLWNFEGRLKDSEMVLNRSMTYYMSVLSISDPNRLSGMSLLAVAYRTQKRWSEAEALLVQVSKKQKEELGEDHPSTFASMRRLASTYYFQGRLADAEAMQTRVVEASKRVFGEDDSHTSMITDQLALTYLAQGRCSEAEALSKRAVENNKKVLGANHHATLASMSNLASVYFQQERWVEAEMLLQRAINGFQDVLGENHSVTLRSMRNLATIYQNQGRENEARELKAYVVRLRANT